MFKIVACLVVVAVLIVTIVDARNGVYGGTVLIALLGSDLWRHLDSDLKRRNKSRKRVR